MENTAVIHVRFSPDGSVTEIGERPVETSPQAWFNRLAGQPNNRYQPLAGGRAVFRIRRAQIDSLKSDAQTQLESA